MSIPFNYSARNLWVRRNTAFATTFGIALVVFVLAAALMLAKGVERALGGAGRPDTALVIQQAAVSEASSNLRQGVLGLVAAAPGVRTTSAGTPLVSSEAVQVLPVRALGDSRIANVQVRGVGDNVFELRPEVRIVAGRRFTAGGNEAIVGRALVGRYEGLALGSNFELEKGHPSHIVGVFSAASSSFESEVWAGLPAVQTATKSDGFVSSVTARLASASDFDAFARALEQGSKEEGLSVERESGYYARISQGLSEMILTLGGLVTGIFSLGALLGAAITMYAAVEQRSTEIAVLRALGFGRFQILVAFVTEAAGLSLIGTIVGLVLASLTALVHFTVGNTAAASAEVTFRFVPAVEIWIAAGLGGTLIGVLGGMLPALRAARVDPARALRG
jgi:putative ABC transport system permease protein